MRKLLNMERDNIMITLQEFIEQYNNHIDWNMEIRDKMDIASLEANPVTKDIVNSYLSGKKISIDNFDVETAEIYVYEDRGVYELQIYSYESYHTTYFWCNPDISKEEYLKERVDVITQEASRKAEEIQHDIEELQYNLTSMNILLRDIKR